jgi:hypothetical protein
MTDYQPARQQDPHTLRRELEQRVAFILEDSRRQGATAC